MRTCLLIHVNLSAQHFKAAWKNVLEKSTIKKQINQENIGWNLYFH